MTILCKKILYNTLGSQSSRVLLGLIESESEHFIIFKTGSGKQYTINKNSIVSIEDTDQEFIDFSQDSLNNKESDGATSPHTFFNNNSNNKQQGGI